MKWQKIVRGGLLLLLPWAHCVCGDVMITTLFSFPSNVSDARFGLHGASPSSVLIGSGGSLYGTTFYGGVNGSGTIFLITPTGTLRTLVNIPANSGACSPLIQSSDGSFLGTTDFGGAMRLGSLFLATTNGGFSTLASFNGNNGSNPFGRLVQGPDGFLYGTARHGGLSAAGIKLNVGTVFKSGTLLYTFGNTNGVGPSDGLALGKDGYFYGVTQGGGKNNAGTVFRISTTGKLVTIHTFSGRVDGATPVGGLIQAADGYLYGTTSEGGSGNGTVFRMDVSGNMMSSISLNGVNGAYPVRRLMQSKDGSIYGTTSSGGIGYGVGNPKSGYGTVFKIIGNALATVISFNYDNGSLPLAELVQSSNGDLFGVTAAGGYLRRWDDLQT